ncbi:phage tail protein [Enterococcus gallinarum]|uniref:phage tail protein n=1 Tax=Enterococcus gallinarum TaxID=1353 RepID=UPI00115D857E|nr:phage tail protein [Enterococcus gallinarum]
MIIHVLDRQFNTLTAMDNSLPGAIHFFNDNFHIFLESVSTLELSVTKSNPDIQYLIVGNYLQFNYQGNDYLMTIRVVDETDFQIDIEAESLTFDLLNESVGEYSATAPRSIEAYLNDILVDSDVVIGLNEVRSSTRTLSWEGDATVLERLKSIVNYFGAEFEIITELNNDRSLKQLTLNIYKEYSESGSNHGVGADRTDITLEVGKNVSSVRKKVDATEIFTSIKPTGNDGLTISSIEEYLYDSNRNLQFYTKKGSPRIYAPMANSLYGRKNAEQGGYIDNSAYTFDTDDVKTLYGNALSQLKKYCEPATTYKVEGYYELNIGDTVSINDFNFSPPLLLEARVAEMEVSFTDPAQNKTVFSNYVAFDSAISSDLLKQLEALKNKVGTVVSDVAVIEITANTAKETADSAKDTATSANNNANQAKDTANTANNTANNAANQAAAANKKVSEFEKTLNDTKDAVGALETDFADQQQALQDAVNKANEIEINVSGVLADVASINNDIDSINADISTINSTVSSVSSKANEAYSKAQAVEGKTVTLEKSVDGLTGRLTAVETTSTSTTKKLNELEVTVDGQKQTLATVQTAANSALSKANVLETTVDGVKTTISQVQTDMKQLSNRNLLSNTATLSDMTISSSNGKVDPDTLFNGNATAKGVHVSPYIDTFSQHTINAPRDGKFTLTFWAKADRDMVFNNFFFTNGTTTNAVNSDGKTSTSSDGRNDLSATTSWKKYWITYTSVNATATRRIVIGRTTSTGTLWINSPMLVEGAVPADWQPAPEDLATVSKVNQVEATVDGVKTTVSSVKTTADSALSKATTTETTVNGLKTTISSVETTANSALTKANTAQSTADGNKATISSVKTTADSALSKATQTETTVNGLKTTVTSVQTTANNALTKATQVEQTANGIRQTVTEVQTDLTKKKTNRDFKTSNTAASDSKKWTKFACTRLTRQYQDAAAGLDIIYNGDGGALPKPATIYIRHKQQDAMGQPTLVEIALTETSEIKAEDLAAVITSSTTTESVVEYYIRNNVGYSIINFSPFNEVSPECITYYASQPFITTLPTGKQATIFGKERGNLAGVTGVSSQITQLSDQINLKVSKGDLISQINVEAGKTLIQTGKLYLDAATVTFSGQAFIPVASIKDLTADAIKVGTLTGMTINGGKITGAEILSEFDYQVATGSTVWRKGKLSMSGGYFRNDFQTYAKSTGEIQNNGFSQFSNEAMQFVVFSGSQTTKADRFLSINPYSFTMTDSRGYGGNLTFQDLYNVDQTGLPAASGFTQYNSNSDSGNFPCARRMGRLVQLAGAFKNSNAINSTADPIKIGTVPVWARPNQIVNVIAQGSVMNKFLLQINVNGDILMSRYGTGASYGQIGAGSWLNIACTYSAADV